MSKSKTDQILAESWHAYLNRFVQNDGRVIDREANQITTSEGQSYALLRAAWMNDQDAFNRIWTWTETNLQDKDIGLFAWKWGQAATGQWTILDRNSASDADEDIALALIIGGSQWKRSDLIYKAQHIISALWINNVVFIQNKPFLTPGIWAKTNWPLKLNPSYLAPYAYRIFAKFDSTHPWIQLVDTSYTVLEQSINLSRLGLPPDWCYIDANGHININADSPESDYGYEALRTPWRIALDYQWNKEPRARVIMDKLRFLSDSWQTVRTIRAGYSARGVMRGFDEPLSGFATVLPLMKVTHPEMAEQILQERLNSVYYAGIWSPEKEKYYDNNWAWLGLAAYSNALFPPNLSGAN